MKSIVTIGLSGFPFGMAAAQKLFLMGKAVNESGSSFLVVNNTFIKKTKLNEKLKKVGRIESVKYLTTSPYIFTPKNIIKKISGKLLGYLKEFFLLTKLRKNQNLDVLIVYSMSFWYTLFYVLISRIYKIPVYLVYFELRSSCTNRHGFFVKINDWLLDNYIFKFLTGVITISENLVRQIQKSAPGKKYIIIPPLVDFNGFELKNKIDLRYFLYCGTLAYFEVIEFIIESYALLKNPEYKLFLILNGSEKQFEKVVRKVEENTLQDNILIYSNLKYEELIDYYTNAEALLIPLRNTPQDTSRFPQKVAEYCASKKPIISNKVGEMGKYFNDSSMIFSDDFEISKFSEKMRFVMENRDQCKKIGLNAYDIGKQYFDYRSFSYPLNLFLTGRSI